MITYPACWVPVSSDKEVSGNTTFKRWGPKEVKDMNVLKGQDRIPFSEVIKYNDSRFFIRHKTITQSKVPIPSIPIFSTAFSDW